MQKQSPPESRLGTWVKCGECKRELPEVDLREHWADEHGEKLKRIDKWLGRREDDLKTYERLAREGMRGAKEGREG